jgi:hypothetical protein
LVLADPVHSQRREENPCQTGVGRENRMETGSLWTAPCTTYFPIPPKARPIMAV